MRSTPTVSEVPKGAKNLSLIEALLALFFVQLRQIYLFDDVVSSVFIVSGEGAGSHISFPDVLYFCKFLHAFFFERPFGREWPTQ